MLYLCSFQIACSEESARVLGNVGKNDNLCTFGEEYVSEALN